MLETTQAQPLPWRSWTPMDWALSTAFAVFGFFASASVAGVYVAQALMLLLAIPLAPRIVRLAPWKSPPMAAGLLLLAYVILHCLWSSGLTKASWHAINSYQELLFAPLLLALMQIAPDRRVFSRALIAGAAVFACIHWIDVWLPQPGLAAFLDSRRISAGFSFATCAFVVLLQARTHARPWALRALAAFFAVTLLFAAAGRTGYLVVVMLVGVAAWQHSPPRWRCIAGLLLPIAVLSLAWSSHVVQKRVHETMENAQPTGQVNITSTGIRVHMLQIAGQLARAHPLIGVGFANYGKAHSAAVKQIYASDPDAYAKLPETWRFTSNPHSEYLMQLLGGGVPALVLFLCWLGITLREAWRTRATVGHMLCGVCLAFALGCVFNSLLLDFVEGHLYMALMAWLLAGVAPARPTSPPA